jgi:NitT/TauT family transport system permease protein
MTDHPDADADADADAGGPADRPAAEPGALHPVLLGEDDVRRSLADRLLLRTWLPPLVAFVALGVGWQLYAVDNPYVLPTIPQIAASIWDSPAVFWDNALVTLQEIAVGAACGMGAAFVLAVVMAEVRVVERALMPLAVALNVTPVVAIAPGLVVAFGFGMLPKYLLTAIIVFFPFLVSSLAGLRDVDPRAVDVLDTLHASRWEVLWRLRLPSSLPFLFAGARICLPLSVVGAVVAEFSAAGKLAGLGSLIELSAQQADLRTIYASVFFLAVIGILLTVLVVVVQSKVLWWADGGRPERP